MKKPFVLIALVGFLLYFPSLFGPFLWDDEDFVYANKYVESFQIDKFFTECATCGRGKLSNYFRPVPEIIYATTHTSFGFNPFWFHFVNILVHIGAAMAVFAFFKNLLERQVASQLGAFLISLFFLVHPVQTEAVSYISGLSDPLFVLFGLLALIYFPKPKSLLFFALSLLSKESGLVFLPLLFLLHPSKKIWPYFLMATIYLWFHFTQINQFNVAAAWGNNLYRQSIVVRLLTFVKNLYTYIGLLLFPKDLFMERDYSIQIQTQILNPSLILSLVLFPTIFYLVRKSKTLAFCFLAFFISFLPYTGLVLINGIFYEHFLYLPLVFFFGFLVFTLSPFLHRRFIALAIVTALILLGLRNVARQFDWSEPVRFYSQTLVHAPQSLRIINGLGIAYADRGDLSNAIKTYQQGIALNPKVPNLYHNLANAYLASGELKLAEENYLKAIEVDENFFFSYQALVSLYRQTGQEDKATRIMTKLSR